MESEAVREFMHLLGRGYQKVQGLSIRKGIRNGDPVVITLRGKTADALVGWGRSATVNSRNVESGTIRKTSEPRRVTKRNQNVQWKQNRKHELAIK
jgi:antitoxin (DNA-binding transcriptional repressor) of toxin-antitoxin stability system